MSVSFIFFRVSFIFFSKWIQTDFNLWVIAILELNGNLYLLPFNKCIITYINKCI